MLHYWSDNGRWWKPWSVAWFATLRYMVAIFVPFWDGDAPGRAYTRREMSQK